MLRPLTIWHSCKQYWSFQKELSEYAFTFGKSGNNCIALLPTSVMWKQPHKSLWKSLT